MQPVMYFDAFGCIVMQMQGEILAEISNARNHWWQIVDSQWDSLFNWECGGCRLKWSTAWDRSKSHEIDQPLPLIIQDRLRARQCGLVFLFHGKSKSENLVRKEGSDVDGKLGLLLILLNVAAQPGSATGGLHQDQTSSCYGVMIFSFMTLLFFSAFSS